MSLFQKEKHFLDPNTKLVQIIDFLNNKSENLEADKIEELILSELLKR